MILIIILLVLAILYTLALRGRVGYKETEKFTNVRYAHRGLHKKNGYPENSLAAFKAAVDKGYGIELDIHLLADGNLAVIHDSSLLRTTGVEKEIEQLKTEELSDYYLEDTKEKIPTLKEVLKLVNGRVPLLIECKIKKNTSQLCSALISQTADYKGDFCVESFDPRCVLWFKRHTPKIVRGQLAEDFIKDKNTGVSFITRILLTALLFNFLNKPDFIAHRFEDRKNLANIICLRFWKMKGFSWTIKSEEILNIAEKEKLSPIFENIEP